MRSTLVGGKGADRCGETNEEDPSISSDGPTTEFRSCAALFSCQEVGETSTEQLAMSDLHLASGPVPAARLQAGPAACL
jgi:hypothetical protein